MDKKTIDEQEDNFEEDDGFDIDELLSEDEDTPTEEVTEEIVTEEKKSRGRPKGSTKVKPKAKVKPEVPVEVANVNKELSSMEWQSFSQQAYDGFQNVKTGEIIDEKEALRRTLCYVQEAARNSR